MFGNKAFSKSGATGSDASVAVDQRMAVLVLGGRRFPCRLDEVTGTGFGVSVAWSQPWEGETSALLQTRDSKYQVVITKQEMEHGGCHLSLKRLEDVSANRNGEQSTWWITASVRSCVMGIAGIVLIQYVANPHGFTRRARQVSVKDVYNYWTFSFRSVKFDSTKKASHSTGSSLPTTDVGATFDPSVPAMSVSMSSAGKPDAKPSHSAPASVSARGRSSQIAAGRAEHVDPQARVIAEATRRREVRDSVTAARREPKTKSSSTSMSWLFSGLGNHPASSRSFLFSQSASKDLSEFKQGLDMLPRQTSREAISSLLDALARTGTPEYSTEIDEMPGVKVIQSDDAAIYFSASASGDVSILRVVPKEIEQQLQDSSAQP